MEYFDTDVLIHSIVSQDSNLYTKTNELIESSGKTGSFCISFLTIQEIGFVLAKLGQSNEFITAKVDLFLAASPIEYGVAEIKRACALARIIGFKNFNDCIHTAIAEKSCTDLYTCNYQDFKKLQSHTDLKIHFL